MKVATQIYISGTDLPAESVNLMTVLTAALVPACAVLLLLIVSAVIAIVYVKRRQRRSVVFKSMDEVEMKSTNQTEAGLVMADKYIHVQTFSSCLHTQVFASLVAILTLAPCNTNKAHIVLSKSA